MRRYETRPTCDRCHGVTCYCRHCACGQPFQADGPLDTDARCHRCRGDAAYEVVPHADGTFTRKPPLRTTGPLPF